MSRFGGLALVPVFAEDELFRRILPDWVKKNRNVSTAAFKYDRVPIDEISVELAKLTTAEECAERARQRKPKWGWGVGAIVAQIPMDLGFTVRHDPDEQENNWAHALIEGHNDDEKCFHLAQATRVRIDPIRNWRS